MTDRSAVALAAGAALAGGVALAAAVAALDPPSGDVAALVAVVGAPAAGAVVAGVALRRWIGHARSLVRVLLAVAAVSAVLVAAAVALAAWAMFLSSHDAGLVAVVVGLAAALAALVARHVSRPLARDAHRLSEVAQQVAAGDLTVRTGIARHDELGGAGRALDHLVSRLAMTEEIRARLEAERAFLLSAIGHDLRTPLAALRATVESLQDGVAPDPDRYLAAMGTQLQAVQQLIEQLFEYGRIEAGRLTFETAEIDLAELVDETVAALVPVADRSGVTLAMEADVARRPALVDGGGAELSRALRNLVDNALRYAPAGTAVRVTLATDAVAAHVSVSDEGPGFPDDFRPRAFEPFTRADPARDRATGTAGLGLAIARGIVDAHGGSIELGAPPGGTVILHLPLAPSRRRDPAPQEVPS